MARTLAMLGLLLFPAASLAAPASGSEEILARRAQETVDVLKGQRDPAIVFNRHFLSDVPPERLAALAKQLQAENGRIIAAEEIRADGKNSVTFRIRFERATANGHLTLEANPPFKASGFRITSVVPINDSPQRIRADFAALPGRSGFAVVRLGDDAPSPILSSRADEQFAIGSTFKLWVLDALAEEIAAGRRRWDEVVRLGPRSLPGGITQDWPPDAPVTVETLATLMISISDNTATDTLIRLIGRERIGERVRATGHSDPSRMLPLLTTAEVFALNFGPAARREAYVHADNAGQARLLDGLDAYKVLSEIGTTAPDGTPGAIESIEWFASPNDIVRVLDSLRRRKDPRVLEILGIASNLDRAERRDFAYAGYKGGSESGVLNLTWLLRNKRGEWVVVTASWNDPARELDNKRLEALAPRLVALARQAS